jgi:PAS domain-containing protein
VPGFSTVYFSVIRSDQKILGMICFFFKESFEVTMNQKLFFKSLASALAVIIQRITADRALEKSKERIFEILDSVTDGFLLMDRKWNFIYANQAAENILGVLRRDLIGKNEWKVFPEFVHTPIYNEEHFVMLQKKAMTLEMQWPGN